MTRILIVEDEPSVADVIEFALRRAGFETTVVGDKESARAQLSPGRFAALVLDLGLPDGDGLELCRTLRGSPEPALNAIPIVMVTCRDEEVDRVIGLEMGADDYLVKPFSPRELAARVTSVLRRANNRFGPEEVVELGPLRLSRVSFRATVDGSTIPLTKTEFELLWVLSSSPHRVFTRDVLVSRAYAGTTVSHRTVDSHIKAIRQKCAAAAPSWDPIETVYGIGYKASVP